MSSWLFGDRSARLAGLANRPAGRRRRRAATGVLLRCESLEDRTLLATVNVQVGNDFFGYDRRMMSGDFQAAKRLCRERLLPRPNPKDSP
jgi:hypothetical protein